MSREEIINNQPKPKTGYWIPQIDLDDTHFGYNCSICRKWYMDKHNYCPNCGVKMEDKE